MINSSVLVGYHDRLMNTEGQGKFSVLPKGKEGLPSQETDQETASGSVPGISSC